MIEALKELTKQPYWVIALILGVALIALPSLTVVKDYHWAAHSPTAFVPVAASLGLLVLSAAAFWFSLSRKNATNDDVGRGLDLTRVKEKNGVVWTTVSGCEMR